LKIKICGITNLPDALDAAALGASSLGFIFSKSPRQISQHEAKAIIKELPPFISTVGVFVNESLEYINEVTHDCKLDIIQLHGNESPDFCAKINRRTIKAIRIFGIEDLKIIDKYKNVVSGILLDTYVVNTAGGTGQAFDWGLAHEAKKYGIPIIVAGGINPDNLVKAVKTASPYAIDLSSGVEKFHGKKDYEKLSKLFQIAHTL